MPILNTECTPESVGLCSTRLNQIATNIIDRFVEENQIPFGQVLVARKNKICYQHQAGMINVKQASPVQNDSIFRIYSMTKPITSVTLMALQEQGCFRLTDPLGLYLPEFDKANLHVYKDGLKQLGNGKYVYNSEPCNQDITIQMLMNHTSGLSYGFDKPGFINPVDRLYHAIGPGTTGQRAGRPDMPLDVYCKKLSKMPLVCQPGTQWNYSLSVDVQGRLIEVLTGKSLYEAMKDIILDPLGMVDTYFSCPKDQLHRFANLYIPNPFSEEDVKEMKNNAAKNAAIMAAAKQKGDKAVSAAAAYIKSKGRKRGGLSSLIPPSKLLSVASSGSIIDFTAATQHSFVKGLHGVDADSKTFESGGGGLLSTMHDYYLFANALANGGVSSSGTRILSRKTMQYMTMNHLPNDLDLGALSTPQYSEIGTAGAGFGLGFSVVTDPTRQGVPVSTGTFAWGGAASTYFWVDPEEELVVLFMTQLLGNGTQATDTKWYNLKGVPMRPMLQSIVYASIIDGDMKSLAKFKSGTPEVRPHTPKL